MQPELIDRSTEQGDARFRELEASGKAQRVVDEYEVQLAELYAIDHPTEALAPGLKDSIANYIASHGDLTKKGKWVYFPWRATVVHVLDDAEYQKVRTARNRELITAEEQKKFYDAVIGIAGLSVGNSVALAIVLQGGSRKIKLADHDVLELTNINRIRTSIADLGISKVEMTAQQIYELNPYAEVELFPEGLTEENMGKFFDGLTIVIDEIDNLAVKMDIRAEAAKRKLPVLMAADNDRAGVIDVERLDKGPVEVFHGRLGHMTKEDLGKLDKRGIGRTIAQLIGVENHTPRMLRSLQEMGKSIVSWPQLGGTALLNGALIAYCALRVANGQPLTDNRVIVDMDALLDPSFDSEQAKLNREASAATFKTIFETNQ